MIQIPAKGKFITQLNEGNILGDLWSSFNLDLNTKKGLFALSPRLMVSSSTEFVATLSTSPCAFKKYNSKYYTISGTRVHVSGSDSINASFTAEATSGFPTNCDATKSDLEVFNNELYVSTDTNALYYFNGSAWASVNVGASDATPHPMVKFASLLYYVRAYNQVYAINSSHAASLILTLGSGEEQIVWMRAGSNRIWLGTINKDGGKGRVYEWDGAASQTTRFYELSSQGTLACVIKNDKPWIIDTLGRLLVWNSGTFNVVASLPLNGGFLLRATSTTNNRFIHPNGMDVIDDEVCFLISNINSDSSGTVNENVPAGVWAFNSQNGLYHKYGFSYHDDDDAVGLITDYGQSRISIPGALKEFRFNSSASSDTGNFLAGALYYTNATSTRAAVFVDDGNDTVQKCGYFVTTWKSSEEIKDTWERIILKYRKFLDSNDKIVVKYRTTEADPVEATITWDNDTSRFYTTTNLTSYVGYEVEVVQGTGAGKCAHITAVTESGGAGGSYFVTLDETFTGVTTGTAKVRIQNWIKISSATGQTTESKIMSLGKTSERIQLKVFIQFTGEGELYQVNIINKPHTLMV